VQELSLPRPALYRNAIYGLSRCWRPRCCIDKLVEVAPKSRECANERSYWTKQVNSLVDKLVCENLKALVPYEISNAAYLPASDNNPRCKMPVWLNANESPFTNDYVLDASVSTAIPIANQAALLSLMLLCTGLWHTILVSSAGGWRHRNYLFVLFVPQAG